MIRLPLEQHLEAGFHALKIIRGEFSERMYGEDIRYAASIDDATGDISVEEFQGQLDTAPKPIAFPATPAMNLMVVIILPGCRAGLSGAGGETGVACGTVGSGARNIIREWIMAGSPFSDGYRRTWGVLKS